MYWKLEFVLANTTFWEQIQHDIQVLMLYDFKH